MENPAPPLSAFPNLNATTDGAIVLSWLEPSGDQEKALRFSVRRGGNWSTVSQIKVSQSFNRYPAVLPAVTMLTDTAFVSYWTQMRKKGSHTEDVYAAASNDGGKNWTGLGNHTGRKESPHGHDLSQSRGQGCPEIDWKPRAVQSHTIRCDPQQSSNSRRCSPRRR
jgi:hypothetical protein